jgi:hypothetical protein
LQGELRIAHCGGFHAAPFNVLVKAINLVATLLGHPIHWDTETVGCEPSLSSIDVTAQRSFADALAELAAWLALPGNEQEFLLVFLDDQPDIKDWVSACDLILVCFWVIASGIWILAIACYGFPMPVPWWHGANACFSSEWAAVCHQVQTRSDAVICPTRGLQLSEVPGQCAGSPAEAAH